MPIRTPARRRPAGQAVPSASVPATAGRARAGACKFHGDHALFDDYTGVVLERSEGVRIADALGPNKAVILRNHGFLTVGETVEAAAFCYLSMDDAAHTQLLAEAAGTPQPIPGAMARHTAGQVGGARSGLLSFQPLWELIVAQEPDLLD